MRLAPPHETIAGTLADLTAGRRTAVDVIVSCLQSIDELEAEVRAWVLVDRAGALEAARQRDDDRAAGRPLGLLHGIPLGIKDIIDVARMPTSAGFAPWSRRVADVDAPIVATLRAAGAVILGKTVTTTFAWIDPPPTRNPWNFDCTPGGSSSGSAAALACGMCLGALGTQTGGSITRPAAYCGVCGLKPTYGRLDTAGIEPLAPSLDHPGPLARTVDDLARLWQALSGDPITTPRVAPPRLGRVRGMYDERAEPVMRQVFEQALETLKRRGAVVVEPELPATFEAVPAQFRTILAHEAALAHRERFAQNSAEYPPRIAALVEEGLAVSDLAYQAALGHLREFRAAILPTCAAVDALITPATIGPAPDRSTTGDPAFNSPWSYAGLPTVCFPIGLSPDGLPLAAQVVGQPGDEAALLAVAAWAERAIITETC